MKLLQQIGAELALGAVFLVGTGMSLAADTEPQKQKATATKKDVSRKAPAKPTDAQETFHVREKLEYQISWMGTSAATAEIEVAERRPFFGREAWHFKALARTVGAVRLLYALDDQFDSYTDTSTLASLRYEMYVREQGKKQETIIRMSTDADPGQGDGPAVRVLPGTRDPLGVLYYLRTLDWQETKQPKEITTPVYDGKKLYEVRAQAVARGSVSVPTGDYSASKIELRIYDRGQELTNTRIWVWLANDAQRTPVLFEAELPFGRLRVELVKAGP